MPQDAYVVDRCSEIEEMLQYATEKSKDDARLGGHLAGYISVLISGVVEDCIEHLVVQRARMSGDVQLQEFVRNSIGRLFRNPQSSDIADVLRNFSLEYRLSYQESLNEEDREALNSIIKNRMSLSHEGLSQSHFTVTEVSSYFDHVQKILGVVEGILVAGSQSEPSDSQHPST